MTPARYEFRVWGEQLPELAERVGGAEFVERRLSAETYLVVRTATTVNPKIRDGVLDVKVCVGAVDAFERWDPKLKAEFPIPAAILASQAFPLLGVSCPPLDETDYSVATFLDRLVDPHPDLVRVEVSKARRIHRVAGCAAEVSEVTLLGRRLATVAIESADLEQLRVAHRLLGLEPYQNRSYPAMIREALGWPVFD